MATRHVSRSAMRPSNRRDLIVAAATQLFHQSGYDHTAMSDIAASVGIGPSALYRHFPSKAGLLADVITTSVVPMSEFAARLELRDRQTTLRLLVELALDHRHFGVLWQRESRRLVDTDRRRIRAQLNQIISTIAHQIRRVRAELDDPASDFLATSLATVLTSPSFHQHELTRSEHVEVLVHSLARVLDFPFPHGFTSAPAPHASGLLTAGSRREALLVAAVEMFSTRGYAEVSLNDLGSAVGISGPSVYNHFERKIDMLSIALHRATGALFTDITSAYGRASSAQEVLQALISSYSNFCRAHHVLGLLLTETGALPLSEQDLIRSAQREYLNEWTHLLLQARPDLDSAHARVLVCTVIDLLNGVARTPHLRRNPDTFHALHELSVDLLGLRPNEARPKCPHPGTPFAH